MSTPAEHYQATKRWYTELAQLSTSERQDRLDALRAEDPTLASDVEALLQPLSAPPVEALPAGYTLLERIGLGGMGVVYRAKRVVDGVAQTVALKLLRHAGLATSTDRARFESERRILARLDHPHIARLLDAGTDEHGRAWFAMEHVDGERIDAYCRSHALDARARVQLFVLVARAVDAAHRQLVVHRDLKPSNVLVDRHGVPKLLDFGIARLLSDEDEALTGTGDAVLTLRYASPEQIAGEPVTPASDVYALGVMLFELLTERSPYGDATSQPLTLPELIRASDAPKASTQALTPWGRELRGDLDAIVEKCLRKAPLARYAGADLLAADLEAWLERRPVEARRGTRGYRAARWLTRHRVAVSAAVVVLALTAGFVWRLNQELAASEQERLRAEAAVARSQATAAFLSEMFKDAHPDQAKGKTFTLREALDRGVRRLQTDLDAAPRERIDLLLAAADIYSELALGEPALAAAGQALEAAQTLGDDEQAMRARLARSWALEVAGKLDEAEAEARVVAEQAMQRHAEAIAFDALVRLSNIRSNNDKVGALALYDDIDAALLPRLGVASSEQATKARVTTAARDNLQAFARNRHNRCAALSQLGRATDARPVCEQARDLKARLWPADHPIHLTTLTTLAAVAADLGDVALALRIDEELAALFERLYGPEHPKTGVVLLNWAADLGQQARDDEAAPLLDRAISIFEKLGPAHRGYLMGRNNRANLLRRQGQLEQSLAEHRAVAQLRRDAFGESHADVAQSDMNVANLLADLGRDEEAIGVAERAMRTYESTLGPASPESRRARMNLANKYFSAKRYEEAVLQAEQALRDALADETRPQDRGLYQFALAQPLWELGHGRDRALQLATEARSSIAQQEQYADDLVAIDAWLKDKRGAPLQ